MTPTTARLVKILANTTLGVAAQLVLATATASAGPTTGGPCTVPAAPVQQPAPTRHAGHVDTPVRAGDLCQQAGTTAVAQPGMRPVVCGQHRGLNHLTWG